MKNRNLVIANRHYIPGVKHKQIGLLDISALSFPKKIRAFRCFLYHLEHVHIPRKVASN